jgi:hypothetical protein
MGALIDLFSFQSRRTVVLEGLVWRGCGWGAYTAEGTYIIFRTHFGDAGCSLRTCYFSAITG